MPLPNIFARLSPLRWDSPVRTAAGRGDKIEPQPQPFVFSIPEEEIGRSVSRELKEKGGKIIVIAPKPGAETGLESEWGWSLGAGEAGKGSGEAGWAVSQEDAIRDAKGVAARLGMDYKAIGVEVWSYGHTERLADSQRTAAGDEDLIATLQLDGPEGSDDWIDILHYSDPEEYSVNIGSRLYMKGFGKSETRFPTLAEAQDDVARIIDARLAKVFDLQEDLQAGKDAAQAWDGLQDMTHRAKQTRASITRRVGMSVTGAKTEEWEALVDEIHKWTEATLDAGLALHHKAVEIAGEEAANSPDYLAYQAVFNWWAKIATVLNTSRGDMITDIYRVLDKEGKTASRQVDARKEPFTVTSEITVNVDATDAGDARGIVEDHLMKWHWIYDFKVVDVALGKRTEIPELEQAATRGKTAWVDEPELVMDAPTSAVLTSITAPTRGEA